MAIQKRLMYLLHKKFLPFWPLSEHLSSLPSPLGFTLNQTEWQCYWLPCANSRSWRPLRVGMGKPAISLCEPQALPFQAPLSEAGWLWDARTHYHHVRLPRGCFWLHHRHCRPRSSPGIKGTPEESHQHPAQRHRAINWEAASQTSNVFSLHVNVAWVSVCLFVAMCHCL